MRKFLKVAPGCGLFLFLRFSLIVKWGKIAYIVVIVMWLEGAFT